MGKLTEDDKKSLEDYFAEKQYDPSKDPAQATDGFAQKMMCSGGEAGYSNGGPVKMDDGGLVPDSGPWHPADLGNEPSLVPPGGMDGGNDFSTGVTDSTPSAVGGAFPYVPPTAKTSTEDFSNVSGNPILQAAGAIAPHGLAGPAAAAETPWMPGPFPPTPPPRAAGNNAQAAFNAPTGETPLGDQAPTPADAAPAPAPAAPAGKMAPDDYADLIASLKPGLGTRLAQGAFSGLGAFADAIQAGVARAGPGQNLSNIRETQQNQKQNLIQALREKYDKNFKQLGLDKDMAISKNTIKAENDRAAAERASAENIAAANRDAENQRAAAELGVRKTGQEQDENKTAIEEADKSSGIINALENFVGAGNAKPNPTTLARAQGHDPVHSTPQAQAIRAQYQAGKITAAQAKAMLQKLRQ